jgi:hypothetical protein
MEELTHKQLLEAARDLNKVLGLKPAIAIMSREALIDRIKQAVADAQANNDDRLDSLTDKTIDIINILFEQEQEQGIEESPPTLPEGEVSPCYGKSFDAEVGECIECAEAEKCKETMIASQQKQEQKEGKQGKKKQKKEKKSSSKIPKPQMESGRRVLLDILCQDPTLSRKELISRFSVTGIKISPSTLNTVYFDAMAVIKRLRANGLLK